MNPVESRPTFFLEDPKDIYIFPLPPLTELKPEQIKELIPPLIKEWLKFRCIPSDPINPHKIAPNLSLRRYEDLMGLLAVGFQTRRRTEVSYTTFKNVYFDGLINGQVEEFLMDAKNADPNIVGRIFGEVKRDLPLSINQESRPRIGVRRSPRHQSIDINMDMDMDIDKLKMALDELRKEGGLSIALANILELREIKNLSQIEVAKLLGITLQLVKMWEGKAWQRVKKEESLTTEKSG